MNINRRTVIAALPFAGAVATAASASEVQPSSLAALIAAHEAIWNKFGEAADRLNRKENAYEAHVRATGGTTLVHKSLGGAMELRDNRDSLKADIAADFFKVRNRLNDLARIAPELTEQAREALDKAAAKDILAVDAAYEQEAERKRKFGLTKVRQAWDDINDQEATALLAVCAFQCSTVEEYRMKGLYLARDVVADSMEDFHKEALTRSLA
jgi:hypothetical protein